MKTARKQGRSSIDNREKGGRYVETDHFILGAVSLVVAVFLAGTSGFNSNKAPSTGAFPAAEAGIPQNLPLHFVSNQGQENEKVVFSLRGPSANLFFTKDEVVYGLPNAIIRQKIVGANSQTILEGTKKNQAKVNYLIGPDSSKWKQNLPTYSEVVYKNIYRGIDLAFSGTFGALKSEFRVAPGAKTSQIRLAYEGIDGLSVSDTGDLVIKSARHQLTESKPYIYQVIQGYKVAVSGRYKIMGDQYGFEIGRYDSAYPLVIDPTLTYSTYLGGTGGEMANGIALDASNNIYVTGWTVSTDFPAMAGSFDPTANGNPDVFVTKLNPSGTTILYSTYLGGSGFDGGNDIIVNAAGEAIVVGRTESSDFPVQGGPPGDRIPSGSEAFVAKLNAAGSGLVFSTRLGGGNDDEATAVALDPSSRIVIAGNTRSADFPVTDSAFQSRNSQGDGGPEMFITRLRADAPIPDYSTYLGGEGWDTVNDMAVDSLGVIYVTGPTSSNFPVSSATAPFRSPSMSIDILVAGFIPGSGPKQLIYSVRLGGNGRSEGRGIAVNNRGGIATVAGFTEATDFPNAGIIIPGRAVVPPIMHDQPGQDAVLASIKMEAGGPRLILSTYLGGNGDDSADAIILDSAGNFHLFGATTSTDFRLQDPFQMKQWGVDYFLTKVSGRNLSILYSTYLGGNQNDSIMGGISKAGMTIDSTGNVYVAAPTVSDNFPVTADALRRSISGGGDAIVSIISPDPPATVIPSPECSEDANCDAWETCVAESCIGRFCTVDADCPAGLRVVCQGRQCTMPEPEVECRGNSDCAPGQVCEAGSCVDAPPATECDAVRLCPPGEVCEAGTCVAERPAVCGEDAPCAPPLICVGGECMREEDLVGPPCNADGSCSSSTRSCQNGFCLERMGTFCDNSSPCPSAFQCLGNFCQPRCENAGDCAAGQICEAGTCVEEEWENDCNDEGLCPAGTFCAWDRGCLREGDQCSGTSCDSPPVSGRTVCLGGVCVVEMLMTCNDSSDCRSPELREGGICVLGLCLPPELAPTCASDRPCRDGLSCVEGLCVTRDTTPPENCTTNRDCGEGWECRDGICVDPNVTRVCNGDSDCIGDEICRDNACVMPECSDMAPCPTGEVCEDGACVAKALGKNSKSSGGCSLIRE